MFTNKNMKYYNEIKLMLYNEYDKLKNEFNINYPCLIASKKDEFEINYKNLYRYSTETAEELAVKYLSDNTLMYSKLFLVLKTNECVQGIIIPEYALLQFLFANLKAPKHLVEDYLKISLRHEVGHCLSNEQIFRYSGYVNGGIIFHNDLNVSQTLWEEYTKDKDYDNLSLEKTAEYYRYYHNLPMEKKANDIVGIDIDKDIVSMEIDLIKFSSDEVGDDDSDTEATNQAIHTSDT